MKQTHVLRVVLLLAALAVVLPAAHAQSNVQGTGFGFFPYTVCSPFSAPEITLCPMSDGFYYNTVAAPNTFQKLNTGGVGPKGDPGVAGAAATIAPGTVTMLPSTSAPTVTNSGDKTNAVFNFGIPQTAPAPPQAFSKLTCQSLSGVMTLGQGNVVTITNPVLTGCTQQ